MANEICEVWRSCSSEPERLEVSSLGRVRTIPRLVKTRGENKFRKLKQNILKQTRNAGGFCISSGKTGYLVHRLVADAFVLNPHGLDVVTHINGDIYDNRFENLSWVSKGSCMSAHGHASHGSHTGTYSSWANMMSRSWWGNCPESAWYKDAGIIVCERWHDFEKFYADMGDRPEGCSIDRIDNSNGYCLSNCRWATRKQQSRNTSRTKRVAYGGKIVTFMDLCDALGLSSKALRARATRRGNDYVAALRSIGVECDHP